MTVKEADTTVPVLSTNSDDDEQEDEKNQSREDAHHDISYHPGFKIQFFDAPQQRQKWGDIQVLPRTNWGDLFFDLFYVAAFYNTGNILFESPTATGFLYFIGTFFPVVNLWQLRVFFDARYALGDDLWHRLYEIAVLIVLATAVLHIRPVDIMSNPKDNVEMFAFALSMALSSCLLIGRYIETFVWGVGQRVIIKTVSLRDMQYVACSLVMYLAAAIYAGTKFYGSNEDETKEAAEDDHRMLAEEAKEKSYESYDSTNVPIYLCFFGYVASCAYIFLTVVVFYPKGGKHKEITIPINIDFSIHRNGEWIMLCLGESLLSLLIVDTSDSTGYYVAFYSGVLTIILGQLLHYRSQPHHADDHAMRRNKNAGIAWNQVNQIYSAALICIGVAFQLFVQEYSYEERRRLLEDELVFDITPRWLAGGGGSKFSEEERQQRSANLFCASLATVWLCSDLMLILHHGLGEMRGRCRCKYTKKFNVRGSILIFIRLCLLVFIATLSQWETDPDHVAVIGLAGVFTQLLLRVFGSVFFPSEQVHAFDGGPGANETEDPEENKWPNVTHAVAEAVDDVDL